MIEQIDNYLFQIYGTVQFVGSKMKALLGFFDSLFFMSNFLCQFSPALELQCIKRSNDVSLHVMKNREWQRFSTIRKTTYSSHRSVC